MTVNPAWLSQGAEVLVSELEGRGADALHCDVLIVGSGYGGAVAAARFADMNTRDGAPLRIVVLERGREYVPGTFPARFADAPGHVRFSTQNGSPPRGRPEALFDLRIGGDVGALVGCGLGGGSLINAAVMERPRAEAFARGWPARMDLDALQEAYAAAESMLAPVPRPAAHPPAKFESLASLGTALGAPADRARLAIAFQATTTSEGVALEPCNDCGDCVSGCNQRAKRSLDTNYLAYARARGVQMYCGATVRTVRQAVHGWEVAFYFTDPKKAAADTAPYRVRARQVVLAAGTLGSTEILLRSAQAGLAVSPELGKRFSGNGDLIAAAYRQQRVAHPSAHESVPPDVRRVGPTITGIIRTTAADGTPLAIEEFAVPALLRRVLGEVVVTEGMLHELTTFDWRSHRAPVAAAEDPLAVSDGAIEHTAVYGVMGDDGARGRIELPRESPAGRADAAVRLVWPKVDAQPVFAAAIATLERGHAMAPDLGGTVFGNPLWRFLPEPLRRALRLDDGPAFTVHPLGGCAMAATGAHGVVDRCGRVFNGASDHVHDGLAVLDGSIVPVSLGINPALTIAALAEHALPDLARAWGYRPAQVARKPIDPCPPVRPLEATQRARTAIRISEQLIGPLAWNDTEFDAVLQVRFGTIDDLTACLATVPRRLSGVQATLWLYDKGARDDPAPRGAPFDRARKPRFEIALAGEVSLLEREPSNVFGRILRVWRGVNWTSGGAPTGLGVFERLALASNIGEKRAIVYRLRPRAGDTLPPGAPRFAELVGRKTIAYGVDTNPWRQLMRVEWCADSGSGLVPLGPMDVDLGYFARARTALAEIVAQADQPNALADLAGLALYALRMLAKLHLPAFRVPNDQPAHDSPAERLPQRLADIDRFEAESLLVEGAATPRIRLARYAMNDARTDRRPVLLVHGYGASGTTFAEPSIGRNLVRYLAQDRRRDVWVVDLRTSIGLEQREPAWSFEEIGAADLACAIERIGAVTGAARIDIVAHCIGAAMLAGALLAPDAPEALVRARKKVGAIVLSQVGPLMELSPLNRLRGYVMSYLREYVATRHFDVRPRDPRSGEPLRLVTLLDSVAATFPYPAFERSSWRVTRGRDFRLVRHRADAIFGQLMELDNVGDATLARLDAIYGWVNVEGLAQTIHFAERRMVTDVDGFNRIVARANVAEHLAMPILLVHGRRNAIFDWQGSRRTLRFLNRIFNSGGAIAAEPIAGGTLYRAGARHALAVFDGYGHQDCLIGARAHRVVFPRIGEFLEQHAAGGPAVVVAQPAPAATLDRPWLGPSLGWIHRVRGDRPLVGLHLMVHANPRRAQTSGVVFVAARRASSSSAGWLFDYDQAALVGGESGNFQGQLLRDALVLELPDVPGMDGLLVLTLHEFALTAQERTVPSALFPTLVQAPPAVIHAVKRFEAAANDGLEGAILILDPRTLAAADCGLPDIQTARAAGLRFALASCQYPRGLLDEGPAQASLERLAKRLDSGSIGHTPQFLVLAGDQVYLDSTAGVFDPRSGATRAIRAYEQNFRLPPMRAITRRIATYAVLDDHELADNWEPGAASAAGDDESIAVAQRAYARHQRKLAPPTPQFFGRSQNWYTFAPAGFPFFVLDTRTRRERRVLRAEAADIGVAPADTAAIVSSEVLAELCDWLRTVPRALPKFIVSPSVVLPLERHVLERPPAERIASDGWCGYPASLGALLGMIRDEAIANVVFLSGDLHLSAVTRVALDRGPGHAPLDVYSIVSSGLYAPWPFANALPREYHLEGAFRLEIAGAAPIEGFAHTPLVACANGFAVAAAVPVGERWRLDVTLDSAAGLAECRFDLD